MSQDKQNMKNKKINNIKIEEKSEDNYHKEDNEAKLKKDVIINYEENKDILGGLLIKFEDNVIDLSLKTKFDDLRKNI